MKRWVCSVCGYIHEGPEPPDECPVCGADKSMFEEVPSEKADTESAPGSPSDSDAAAVAETAPTEAATKKWECTVCGYIHEGPEPPDECPVCGADKSAFVELAEDAPETSSPAAADSSIASKKVESSQSDGEPEKPSGEKPSGPKTKSRPDPRAYDLGEPSPGLPGKLYHALLDQMLKHHAHPVSVHVPNGVIPFSFLFVLLYIVTGCKALEIAAFVNMVFVVLALPFVIFSGYVEWQKRYRGFPGNRFIQKIAYAAVVAASAVILVVWRLFDPDVLAAGSSGRWPHVILYAVMLGAAAMAGLIGGKFVFRD
jgi:rubredoxin